MNQRTRDASQNLVDAIKALVVSASMLDAACCTDDSISGHEDKSLERATYLARKGEFWASRACVDSALNDIEYDDSIAAAQ